MMADQFKGNKGVLEATLALSHEEGSPTLSIRLNNPQTFARHHLAIDEEYIRNQDAQFTDNICSVIDLYEHLVAEFDRLQITEDGAIVFEIEVTIRKKLERKAYQLQAERQKVNAIDRLGLQMDKVRREMEEDSERKERHLRELQDWQTRSERENKREMETLRTDMKQRIEEERTQRSRSTDAAQR